MPTFTRVLAI